MFGIIPVIAQVGTTNTLKPLDIPAGFNWLYIVFFALGMLLHYSIKVFHTLGKTKFLNSLYRNFSNWFINKYHYTALSGAAAAIIGIATAYEMNINFSIINLLGAVISIMAGYIGDSMFNAGEIK